MFVVLICDNKFSYSIDAHINKMITCFRVKELVAQNAEKYL